ncbi:hypothetical protein RYX36_019504 [Vicia faba]
MNLKLLFHLFIVYILHCITFYTVVNQLASVTFTNFVYGIILTTQKAYKSVNKLLIQLKIDRVFELSMQNFLQFRSTSKQPHIDSLPQACPISCLSPLASALSSSQLHP